MKTVAIFTIIVVSFLLALVLFVWNPLEPRGVIDFGPPSVTNFTGTTTVREVYGYICEFSHNNNGGFQGSCDQGYYGLLQVPGGPFFFPIWIVCFVIALTVVFFVWHGAKKEPRSDTNIIDASKANL